MFFGPVHRKPSSRVEVEYGFRQFPRGSFPMLRILATLAAAFLPAFAFAEEAPDALVKRVTDEVLAIIKSDKELQQGNTAKVVELAEQKVLPNFDFERMTRLAISRNWAKANDGQKQEIDHEISTLL